MLSSLRSHWSDLVLALAVFLSRLPFLGPGAGNDNDAWFLVNAARELAATGRYTTSRFPGYPVQEWLCSWIARAGGGPEAMNALSAAAGAMAVWLFARLLRRLGARHAWLGALALAGLPAASVASVSAMDYLLAVAFVLAACHARLASRDLWAGLWLGLAIGTRLTSVALLPALLLLPSTAGQRGGGARGSWSTMLLALVVGAACYVPAQARYGWGFLRFVDPLGTGSTPLDFVTGLSHLDRMPIPPALVLAQATVLLWGVLGSIALAAAFVAGLVWRASPRALLQLSPAVARASLVAITAELLLYVRLPHDEGYLLPAVPFVLLLAAAATPIAWYRVACVAIALSSFVFGVDSEPPRKGVPPASRSVLARSWPVGEYRGWVDPLRGPLLQDHDKRMRAQDLVTAVIRAHPRPPRDTLLFAGVLCAELTARAPQDRAHPWYTDYLSEVDTRELVASGHAVLLLPGALERVRSVAGYDPLAAGARPWPEHSPTP